MAKLTVGIDLGDRSSSAAVLDTRSGELLHERRIRTTAAALARRLEGQPRMRIALEVGTPSPWISRLLASELLAPVRHPSATGQRGLGLLRARAALVRSRTPLINHLRRAVKAAGGPLPSCSAESLARQAAAMPESLRPALGPILALLAEFSEPRLQRQLEALVKSRPDSAPPSPWRASSPCSCIDCG